MSFFYDLDANNAEDRRTAAKLLPLKEALTNQIPPRQVDDMLLLATWNIREFDSSRCGFRTGESLYYIAEIASRFDLIAIQEIREDISYLEKLKNVMGDHWEYIVTDVTEGRPGNGERMAFLFDSRKVRFGGLAGEIVVPAKRIQGKEYNPAEQLARTPFIAGFSSGWFKFMLCTVHIYYGTSRAVNPKRLKEIQILSRMLKERATAKAPWARNLILLGDFNIFRPADVTFQAITDQGFYIPEELTALPTNVSRNKHYDQIAFLTSQMALQKKSFRAGVFNFFDYVYGDDEESVYKKEMGGAYLTDSRGRTRSEYSRRRYYRQWRTHQISDHLPMWVALKTDFGDNYLEGKAAGK